MRTGALFAVAHAPLSSLGWRGLRCLGTPPLHPSILDIDDSLSNGICMFLMVASASGHPNPHDTAHQVPGRAVGDRSGELPRVLDDLRHPVHR